MPLCVDCADKAIARIKRKGLEAGGVLAIQDQIVQSQLEFSSDQYFDCGNHADIFKGIYRRVHRVAVKMSKNGIEKNNDISLQHESYVLEKLVGCNHIVSKKDYFQTFRKFGVRSEALILQFIQGTNLNDYLHASGGHGPVSECNARMLCAQLLQAAHFMHARGIVHRDLQPSNVMLSQDELGRSHLTVIDFNLATISSNVDEPNIVCSHGTSGYRPPEVLAEQPSGPAVDIWAIGVILYEMITCDYHMKDVRETEAQFHQRLPQGIEENNDLSDDLKDILIAMLQNDPTKRPTAKDLLESHPWIHHVEIQNGLTIDTAIGQGLYAQVSRAKLNGATVAVKIQKRNANSQNSLANENAHLEKLDFPNIVKPQAYFENALGQEMLVLEYVEGRQLGEYLFSENRSLTEMEVKPFAVQLLGALEHMHSHDVVHRDLHMGNVLISNDAVNLTVIDFNLASDSKPHTGAGILAPEVRLGRPSGPPVDVWSVGLLVLEMLVGRAKFGNEYNVSADSSLITRSNLSDQCQDFLRRMLQQNPEERPTASTLLEHPWIQNSELAAI